MLSFSGNVFATASWLLPYWRFLNGSLDFRYNAFDGTMDVHSAVAVESNLNCPSAVIMTVAFDFVSWTQTFLTLNHEQGGKS